MYITRFGFITHDDGSEIKNTKSDSHLMGATRSLVGLSDIIVFSATRNDHPRGTSSTTSADSMRVCVLKSRCLYENI